MITKHGIVRIYDNKLEAGGFQFDSSGTYANCSCTNEIIDWAIARLESERIPEQALAATEQGEKDD